MTASSYNVEHSGIDSSSNEEPPAAAEEKKTKRPDNTAFMQQRLPAWQPVLTPKSVLPTYFIIALTFIPLGALFLITSDSILEKRVEYTSCVSAAGVDCSALRHPFNESTIAEPCQCQLNVTLDEIMPGPVYVYYGLDNFYQNHRRYVRSRDDKQLIGDPTTASSISNDCDPYKLRDGLPIAPCGAIANSLFNDTFAISDDNNATISVSRKGIAWPSDHNIKFQNPAGDTLAAAFNDTAQPFFWENGVPVYELDTTDPDNNGYRNEALIVWMRTAAFPNFRKLYGIITADTVLNPGTYSIMVDYYYPVTAFGGKKHFIMSTANWLGGKNSFLGIAYIVVGVISLLTGIGLMLLSRTAKSKK